MFTYKISNNTLLLIVFIFSFIIYITGFILKKYSNFKRINLYVLLLTIIISTIGLILISTNNISSSDKHSHDEPHPHPIKIECNNSNDCPNKDKFSCENKKCILNSSDKLKIVKYLDSVYPSKITMSSMLSDIEIYNFFMLLGYYWVSYHNNVENILHTIDNNFPKNVQCGGYYTRGNSQTLCGSSPHTNIAKNWPCNNGCPPGIQCCKPGTLSFPPNNNQLYYTDYIQKDIEVLRNGYDFKDFHNKSILYNPSYLYKINKLNEKNAINYLPLIKNGLDNTGKNINYNVCNNTNTYDFTKKGPGIPSNEIGECTRDHGVGGSPDIFYYICSGTGNLLNIGTTLRSANKIHALLLIIRRAGELNFGSVSTYKYSGYTITKTKINLKDKIIKNSFIETPQLLLLEYCERSNYTYTMNCLNTEEAEFGTDDAKKIAPNVDWPFSLNNVGWEGNNNPQGAPDTSYRHLLKWYFAYKKVTLPDLSDYSNNWSNWSSNQVKILGDFYNSITEPQFDSWKINYSFNRISNSAHPDVIIYQLINPAKVEITGYSLDVNPLDKYGKPFNGITNYSGKYLDTISFSIQPNGGGAWAYELIDYRLSIKAAGGNSDYWTKYTNKFIKVGNILNSNGMEECTPYFCKKSTDPYCEILNPQYGREDTDWKAIICSNPLNPSPPTPPPTPPSPSVPQCKNISDGAEHNYCSGWCNTPGAWDCGKNQMNNGEYCSCLNCNGCNK
uniref:Uncharacterized protein n=1 Tax=viral metagenome TaxID=1070528 RepID=A0A6C0LD46_9ZZZZ